VINVELPAGYHLNPHRPQRYKVSTESGATTLFIDQQTLLARRKACNSYPYSAPRYERGRRRLRVSFTFVYCREDNTGTCRIKNIGLARPG